MRLLCLLVCLFVACQLASAGMGVKPKVPLCAPMMAALDTPVSVALSVQPVSYVVDLGTRPNATLTYKLKYAIKGKTEICATVVGGGANTFNDCLGPSNGGSGAASGSAQLIVGGRVLFILWCNKGCNGGTAQISFTLTASRFSTAEEVADELQIDEADLVQDVEVGEDNPSCCTVTSPQTAQTCGICCPMGRQARCNPGPCYRNMNCQPAHCSCG